MKHRIIGIGMTILMLVAIFAACSKTPASSAPPASAPAPASVPSVATTPSPSVAPSPADNYYKYEAIPSKNYTWGTSGTSGTHYVVAAGIANIVNKNAKSANFVVQSTAGATENLALMLSGEMDFGYMTSNSTYHGYHKTDYMADRVPEEKLYNVVMNTHGSTGHMLARVSSGIKSFADLKGKNVSTGTSSVEGHTVCETLIGTYGIDVKNDMNTFWLSQNEAMERLQDGDLDAVYLTAGYPITAFTNLVVSKPGEYTLVQADLENLKKVVEQLPFLSISEVPAGTYPGLDFSVNALRTAATVNTPAKTPDAVTYELAKYTYENWAEIQSVHAALLETDAEGLAESVIPLHPGALSFFHSVGAVQ
jgi:TRAP transporter TAXI family solute receptor